jgi:hypothetical protein
MHENIYALAHGPEENPTFFYCGKTVQPVEARFRDHLRGMRNPLDHKPAYEYARHIGIDAIRVVFLDSTENGLTENDYVRTLIEAGHPIQNANQGNTKVAKKRSLSLFTVINRDALARTAEGRRNRLHGEAQTLTKPEIVRQRVLGGITDAATLDALDWRPSVCELMPFKPLPKRPEEVTVEMLKWGDLNIFIAFKKGKWAYWVKNTRTALADSYKVNWRSARKGFTRRDGLEQIVAEFPRFTWWPLSSRDPLR